MKPEALYSCIYYVLLYYYVCVYIYLHKQTYSRGKLHLMSSIYFCNIRFCLITKNNIDGENKNCLIAKANKLKFNSVYLLSIKIWPKENITYIS